MPWTNRSRGPRRGLRGRRATISSRGTLERGAQRPEELAQLLRQGVGLLHRGEVAAARHHAPAPDVGEGALGDRARRAQDLARELAVAGRHRDAVRYRPGSVQARVVGPERGGDGACEPVEANVAEQLVPGEYRLDVAVAVR